jgi:hypothetical protein
MGDGGQVELVKSTMREIRGDGGATKLAAQSQTCLVFQERAETSLFLGQSRDLERLANGDLVPLEMVRLTKLVGTDLELSGNRRQTIALFDRVGAGGVRFGVCLGGRWFAAGEAVVRFRCWGIDFG